MSETPFVFACHDARLVGVLHAGDAEARRGVVIVNGGPQYRVGGHRQQVLLARRLSAAGFPTLRFDFRGSGDADGAVLDFDTVDAYQTVGDDLAVAVAEFRRRCPQVREVVLWGICSAATALMIHAADHREVTGIVTANPWVRTKAGLAKTTLKYYYLRKAWSAAFWQKLVSGKVKVAAGLRELAATALEAARRGDAAVDRPHGPALSETCGQGLLVLAAAGLKRYRGRGLLILSGKDLTAAEFKEATRKSPDWCVLLSPERWQRCELADADHTFSGAAARDAVAECSIAWLSSW